METRRIIERGSYYIDPVGALPLVTTNLEGCMGIAFLEDDKVKKEKVNEKKGEVQTQRTIITIENLGKRGLAHLACSGLKEDRIFDTQNARMLLRKFKEEFGHIDLAFLAYIPFEIEKGVYSHPFLEMVLEELRGNLIVKNSVEEYKNSYSPSDPRERISTKDIIITPSELRVKYLNRNKKFLNNDKYTFFKKNEEGIWTPNS